MSNYDNYAPKNLKGFIGQEKIVSLLDVYIKSSLKRNACLDHIILHGPPGLGKTTLANIIAHELNVDLIIFNANSIRSLADMINALTKLHDNDILFIDEIHKLPTNVEEFLYDAMDNFVIDLKLNKSSDETFRMDISKFTLIGATTKLGGLSIPFKDRFFINFRFEYYLEKDLIRVIENIAKYENVNIQYEALSLIAKRSRSTPRVAINLFKRIRDFALILNNGIIDKKLAEHAFTKLEIDEFGLNRDDRIYLYNLIQVFNGGPVGVKLISKISFIDFNTVELIIEPYLIKIGFVLRTNRGRIASKKAVAYYDSFLKGNFSNEN
ncbi:MAG: Holliday junction branch migration DNA helicase RuvB [Anaeroplasmataceae bacterium]